MSEANGTTPSNDVASVSVNGTETVVDADATVLPTPEDVRSDDQKEVDKALTGSTDPVAFDKGIAKIVGCLNNVVHSKTGHYIQAGEHAWELLIKEQERRGETVDRATIVDDMELALRKSTDFPESMTNVNTLIASFWVVRLYFSTTEPGKSSRTFVKPDKDFLNAIPYTFFITLKVLLERDKDENMEIKKGCGELFRTLIAQRLKGTIVPRKTLEKQCSDHLDSLSKERMDKKLAGMSQEDVERAERRRQQQEADAKAAKVKRAADKFADFATENGLAGAAIRTMLEERSIIPKNAELSRMTKEGLSEVLKDGDQRDAITKAVAACPTALAKMAGDTIARKAMIQAIASEFTKDDAKALVELLARAGDAQSIAQLFKSSKAVLQAARAAEPAAA